MFPGDSNFESVELMDQQCWFEVLKLTAVDKASVESYKLRRDFPFGRQIGAFEIEV